MKIMWEHEFKALRRSDPELKQFILDREPLFFPSHRWTTKESTLLKAVMDDTFFGFLEVDISVPDHLHSYFEEMPPLFCNTEVKFEDMGATVCQRSQTVRKTLAAVDRQDESGENSTVVALLEMVAAKWSSGQSHLSSRGVYTQTTF